MWSKGFPRRDGRARIRRPHSTETNGRAEPSYPAALSRIHKVAAPEICNVKKDGATRSSGHFDKKQDAVDAGRKISQNQGTEFYIHGKDGKIQNKDSHGNDPYPPKG